MSDTTGPLQTEKPAKGSTTRPSSIEIGEQQTVIHGHGQMPQRFAVLSLLSLSFMLTSTWAGTGSSLGIGIVYGSTGGVIWALPIAGFMTFIVTLGMAELASAYPDAGAQYYWAYRVSSERHRAFAAYMNGWFSTLGWWFVTASATNFIAAMVLGLAILWNEDYVIKPWHQWLFYAAINWLIVAINVLGSRLLSRMNEIMMLLALLTLGATTITLFVCSRDETRPVKSIFSTVENLTGWNNNGFGLILAVSNSVFSFLGTDCAAHMAEEIPRPGVNIPKVMLWPIAIGLLTALPYTIACMVSIDDMDAILADISGLPLVAVYQQGTKSLPATTILMAFFALCFFMCATACGTTCSRTLWAVARDGVVPYSDILGRIDSRFKVPTNASILSGTVISLYGLIFLGSSTAFAAMVGTCIVFLQTSCVLPQAILLFRGRNEIPERFFNLGRWGFAVNLISVIWVGFLNVIYCLPSTLPVTPMNMNYVSVVVVGLVGFVILLWFVTKGKTYKGPTIDLQLVEQRRTDGW